MDADDFRDYINELRSSGETKKARFFLEYILNLLEDEKFDYMFDWDIHPLEKEGYFLEFSTVIDDFIQQRKSRLKRHYARVTGEIL